jgi:competence protein ComEC
MLGSASLFARVPHASIGTPSGILGFFAVAVLIAMLVAAMRMKRPPRLATFAIAFGLFVASNVWTTALAPPVTNGLEVTALDVGQGDAILVRANGATMLVDGGPDPVLVVKRLNAHAVRRIDLLVLTHPHADHVTGLTGVVEHLPVARETDPGLEAELPAYAAFQHDLAQRHIPRDLARAGMRYALGPAAVDVLAPSEPLFEGTDSDLNNNAVVMRVTYGAATVLLGGEEQEEGQQRLLEEQGTRLKAEVFKVPHHGSARFLRSFYAACGAPVALIPVGPNDYGQPAPSSLDTLASLGMRAYRTDQSGDVTVTLDEKGNINVHEQKRALGDVRLPAAA